MGRPTKYNDAYVKGAYEYLHANIGVASGSLPTLEGLSLKLDLDIETIAIWADLHPEFSVPIKKIKQLQKTVLMDDGLYGGKEVNATMAIFLLKCNHGMIETDRRELVGMNGSALKIQILDALDDPYERLGQQAEGQILAINPPVQDKD